MRNGNFEEVCIDSRLTHSKRVGEAAPSGGGGGGGGSDTRACALAPGQRGRGAPSVELGHLPGPKFSPL